MPIDWKETTLGEEVDFLTGFPFQSSEYLADSYQPKLLRGDNIVQGQLRWENSKHWDAANTKGLDAYFLEAGDVVLAMDRPWIEAGLKYSEITKHDLPALLVQRVSRFRGTGSVISKFIKYVIGSREFTDYVLSVQTGTAVPHISGGQIKDFPFLLPPLAVQKAIAAILGALDDKIELNRRMNATLEAMARALFKSWFVDFDPVRAKRAGAQPFGMDSETAALFPSRLVPSELGDIPEGWDVKQFKDSVNFYNSKRVPLSSREREQRKGSYRYYGATSVMDYVDNYLFDGTYVLVGEDGSVITEKGVPFLQYVWGKFWVNNHAHVLQGRNGWSTEAIYLVLAESNIQHLVTGAVQPKLSMGNLSALRFVCPSPQIIAAFCNQIAALFGKIKAISDENAELERTRDYLLPKLISGDIRIPDTEKFVEDA